ncbi:MAG: DNA-protecting protein DprA [Erysipelotrichaceae bacterium]|nr:DNA-protecting protein DprA [Erysipelotrichaceae bacterium]
MREKLIRLAIRYDGDYFKIREALKRQEDPEEIPLQQAITITDEDYPRELLELKYPPFVLFWQGNMELLKKRKIAIVGSREACEYGLKMTAAIAKKLSGRYVIVSGMARGIDGTAHWNCAESIGVLGNGLDVFYPRCNDKLYKRMGQHGLLITEYPAGTKPDRRHFPFRNRIMAALGEKLIVTQTALKSGTMHTVDQALELGREIYVVPYRRDDPWALGCNRLIRQGANIIFL